MPVAEHAEWLHGPRFVRWLEARGLKTPTIQVGPLDRSIRHWRSGSKASVFTADRVLTALGLTLPEVPEALWVDPPRREGTGRLLTTRESAEITRRVVVLGQAQTRVARDLRISKSTVRHHVGKCQLSTGAPA